MGEMINLSVEISNIMNYDIKIAKEITAEAFPEVMRRLKAIQQLLPKEVNALSNETPKEEVEEEKTNALNEELVTPLFTGRRHSRLTIEEKKERSRAQAKRYYEEHKDEINAKARARLSQGYY